MFKSNGRLSQRLTAILVLMAFVPLAVGGVIATWIAYEYGNRGLVQQQDQGVSLASTLISNYLTDILQDLQMVGELSQADPDHLQMTLEAMCLQDRELYAELSVTDEKGQELARVENCQTIPSAELEDRSTFEPFFRARRNELFVSKVSFSDQSNPLVWIAVPIRLNERDPRIVLAHINLTEMWRPLNEMAPAGGYFYVVDERGTVIGYEDPGLVKRNLNQWESPTVNRLFASYQKVLGVTYTGLLDEEVVGSSAAIPKAKWGVVIEQPLSEAQLFQRNLMTWFLILTVMVILCGSLVSVLIAGSIVRPIQLLAKAAEAISRGDLNYEVQIRSNDEVGAVGQAFQVMTAQVRQLVFELEQKVVERTRALEERSALLEKTAQVAREVAQIRDVSQLPALTVNLISQRFGFYHAGIFLVDSGRENAMMVAASSSGGQRMVARGHRRRMGEGIVGNVAQSGQPRVALDVGGDTVWVKSADLPDTRSEMALPLKAGDRVIGVLDVQSEKEAAFTDEDVATLATLAEQVALAIENARLLEESERSRQELEAFYGRQVASAWQERALRQLSGYFYNRAGIEPLSNRRANEMMATALRGQTYDRESTQILSPYRLLAPIRLREQVIGSLLLERAVEKGPWTAEDIAMVETLTAQAAQALENARLLEETRLRVERERTLNDLSARFSRSLDVETVLQDAVRELGRLLSMDEVSLHIGVLEMEGNPGNGNGTEPRS